MNAPFQFFNTLNLSIFATLLACLVLHELGHAIVAYWFGDTTGREQGRLTLNPIPHLDPIMSVFVPLLLLMNGAPLFGGPKPIPISIERLRDPRPNMILVAFAGPFVNFLLACVFLLLRNTLPMVDRWDPLFAPTWDIYLVNMARINIGLMMLNLIPFPPMDGGKAVAMLLPSRAAAFFLGPVMQWIGLIAVLLLLSLPAVAGPFNQFIEFFYLRLASVLVANKMFG
jgi:Zn-dependent protease